MQFSITDTDDKFTSMPIVLIYLQLHMQFRISILAAHPCSRKPCQNEGTCSPNGSGYKCSCPDGFEGKNCQTGNILLFAIFYNGYLLRKWICMIPAYKYDII